MRYRLTLLIDVEDADAADAFYAVVRDNIADSNPNVASIEMRRIKHG